MVTTTTPMSGLRPHDPARGLYAVYARHLDVHEDHVRRELGGLGDGLPPVAASPATSNPSSEASMALMP